MIDPAGKASSLLSHGANQKIAGYGDKVRLNSNQPSPLDESIRAMEKQIQKQIDATMQTTILHKYDRNGDGVLSSSEKAKLSPEDRQFEEGYERRVEQEAASTKYEPYGG